MPLMDAPKPAALPMFAKFVLFAFSSAHIATGVGLLFFEWDAVLGLTGSTSPSTDLPAHTTHAFGVRQLAIGVPMLVALLYGSKPAAVAAISGFSTRCFLDVYSCVVDDFPPWVFLGELLGLGEELTGYLYPASFTTTGSLGLIAIYLCM